MGVELPPVDEDHDADGQRIDGAQHEIDPPHAHEPLLSTGRFDGEDGRKVYASTALYTRFRSRRDHTFAEKLLSAMRYEFGGHVEQKK